MTMRTLNQFFFLLFCFFYSVAMAVPANPKMISYKLPDGSSINLYIRGDERVKWSETEDGYTTLRNKDGFFEYAMMDQAGTLVLSGIQAKNTEARSMADQRFLSKTPKKLQYSQAQVSAIKQVWRAYEQIEEQELQKKTENKNSHIFKALHNKTSDTLKQSYPVILVAFADVPFNFTKAHFEIILNQPNYVSNGATGSVYDYFLDNSFGRLQFKTDVWGPYTLSKNLEYYGANDAFGNDVNPRMMAKEALDAAEADGCDYTKYDGNDDGKIDGVHIIYSGQGEESTQIENQIWAHAWSLQDTAFYDGLYIFNYSCSPELDNPNDITNIGVIVHEMSHVFGIPDFYDTDYSGSSGISVDLGKYDVMASGSWNNNGKTPPYHNVWSRSFLGWQEVVELDSAQEVSLKASSIEHYGYYYKTQTENENFYLENRQKQKWDTYLPGKGLLIFHVDENHYGWRTNCLNCNPNKRGFYIKQADGNNPSTMPLGEGTPFPGTSNKTEFTDITTPNSRSWRKANTEKPITFIREESGIIKFDFMGGKPKEFTEIPLALWMQTQKDSLAFSITTRPIDAKNPSTDTIAVDFGNGELEHFFVQAGTETIISGKNQQKDTLVIFAKHLSKLVLDHHQLEGLYINPACGLSELSVKNNQLKSFSTEAPLISLSIDSNLLDSLNLLGITASLKELSCSHNQIQSISVPSSIEKMNCTYNNLLFSSLSTLADFDLSLNSNIIYAPQNKFFIGNPKTGVIEQGLIHLGSEITFVDQASSIKFVNVLTEEELSVEAQENGDFLFGSEHNGKNVYCLLTNPKLPQFANENALRSENALISRVGIEDNKTSTLHLYPNPVQSTLYFSSEERVNKVEIFNLMGQLVYTEEGKEMKNISVNHLLSGNYILRFYTKNQVYTQKIVKALN